MSRKLNLRFLVRGLLVAITVFLFLPTVVLGQEAPSQFRDVLPSPTQIERLPTRFRSIGEVVATIFNIVIGAAGAIFLVLLLIGGVQYMTAAGNEENTTKAKKLLVDAVIGLVLTLSAWAIGTFILNQFYGRGGVFLPGGGGPPRGPTTTPPTTSQPTRPNWSNYLATGTLDVNAFQNDCRRFGGVPSGRNCTIQGVTYTLQENGDVT